MPLFQRVVAGFTAVWWALLWRAVNAEHAGWEYWLGLLLPCLLIGILVGVLFDAASSRRP